LLTDQALQQFTVALVNAEDAAPQPKFVPAIGVRWRKQVLLQLPPLDGPLDKPLDANGFRPLFVHGVLSPDFCIELFALCYVTCFPTGAS